MSKDYVWHNDKLADILMTVAAIPNVDALSDETLKEFADELKKVDSLVNDLSNEIRQLSDENEMLKGRIMNLAGRINND